MNNPTKFSSPFQFEITFECLQELDDDLEWKMLYVGKAAADSTQDLVLDEILVGPVPVGINKFVLQADAPDPALLDELLGVTVVLVTCLYRNREFVRVGYYVNNALEGHDPESGSPPLPVDVSQVTRQILADKPRVTKFPIPWGDDDAEGTAVPQSLPTTAVGDGDPSTSENTNGNLVTSSMDRGLDNDADADADAEPDMMDDMEDEELDDEEDDEEDEPDGNEEDEVDLEDENE